MKVHERIPLRRTVGFGLALAVAAATAATLITHYDFEGDATDSSGFNNDAVATNVTYDSGIVGSAAYFDGTTSNIESSVSVSGDFSVSMWVRASDTSTAGNASSQWWEGIALLDADIVGIAADWGITIVDGKVAFGIGGDSDETIKSATPVNDDQWHHIAVTWSMDDGAMRLYVDGVLEASGSAGAGIPRVSPIDGSTNLDGAVDDLRIYDGVLSGTEILLSLSADPGSPTGETVTIDPTTTWGTWEGWGVSLAWWAKIFGDRDDLADIFFTTKSTTLNGTTLPGLGLNIARYNAGASSYAPYLGESMQVSPNIIPSRQMEGYWLSGASEAPESPNWDWSVDAKQRSMLLKARDRGANHLELFSNSPMWWMLHNRNPSGADNASNDNLRPLDYANFATYLATIAKYASDNWGITFESVEPFNEPFTNYWSANGTQEGCHFDRDTQETVIGLLRNELDERGLDSVVISASDETSYDAARGTWNAFTEQTRANVDRVNVHGYQYEGGQRDLLYDAISGDGKRLWNSEYGESDASGVTLARNLILDFRYLRMTAWAYWQALDWLGWGLIDANLETEWIGQPERKYYVLAHFTRHIRPGMTIIDGSQVTTVAAYDEVSHKLVLVTMNDDVAQTIPYDLSMFVRADGPVRRWVTKPDSSVSYEQGDDIPVSGKSFQAYFPATTIQTFEISNVDILPQLHVEPAGTGWIRLSWPSAATGYVLLSTTNVADPDSWQPVGAAPVIVGDEYQLMLPTAGDSARFFRLTAP